MCAVNAAKLWPNESRGVTTYDQHQLPDTRNTFNTLSTLLSTLLSTSQHLNTPLVSTVQRVFNLESGSQTNHHGIIGITSHHDNQLEKLEAAKAAWLVCLSLLSFTESDWVWLGLTGSDWVLLGLTGPYWALLGFTGSYWALLGLTGSFIAFADWLTN